MARRAIRTESEQTAAAPMLRRFTYLKGATIGAADGDIGGVEDVYFDDRSWTVRYLVVDTGSWLPGRRVLISPIVIQQVEASGDRLLTNLTRSQVEHSPDVDTARPVSRQQEIELAKHYSYPYYWTGPLRWGAVPHAQVMADRAIESRIASEERGDTHLRSAESVTRYGIRATDGDLGHVEDYLIEDGTWAIRYLIVDPRNWWPNKHVLVSTEWITAVSWNDNVVSVDMTREAVRNAPEYDPSAAVSRDYETRLHGYYGRAGYWDRRPEAWTLWPAA